MKKLIENLGIPLVVVGWFTAFLLACFIYVFVDWAIWLSRRLEITIPAAVVLMVLVAFILWRITPTIKRAFVALWELTKGIMA